MITKGRNPEHRDSTAYVDHNKNLQFSSKMLFDIVTTVLKYYKEINSMYRP
jgi:predicted DNA-binding ArsR family transcriptional regulator